MAPHEAQDRRRVVAEQPVGGAARRWPARSTPPIAGSTPTTPRPTPSRPKCSSSKRLKIDGRAAKWRSPSAASTDISAANVLILRRRSKPAANGIGVGLTRIGASHPSASLLVGAAVRLRQGERRQSGHDRRGRRARRATSATLRRRRPRPRSAGQQRADEVPDRVGRSRAARRPGPGPRSGSGRRERVDDGTVALAEAVEDRAAPSCDAPRARPPSKREHGPQRRRDAEQGRAPAAVGQHAERDGAEEHGDGADAVERSETGVVEPERLLDVGAEDDHGDAVELVDDVEKEEHDRRRDAACRQDLAQRHGVAADTG